MTLYSNLNLLHYHAIHDLILFYVLIKIILYSVHWLPDIL